MTFKTIDELINYVFGTTEGITDTWFDTDNSENLAELAYRYNNKSNEAEVTVEGEPAWMSYCIYDTPKGKLLQQFGMPDSFWFKK